MASMTVYFDQGTSKPMSVTVEYETKAQALDAAKRSVNERTTLTLMNGSAIVVHPDRIYYTRVDS